jgi:hypothetical protein
MPVVALLHNWQGSRLDTHMLETRKVQKTSRITREFGLALKVQLSKVRTDTESGGKADARQEHKLVLSTIAAGVTNAGTNPLPVESQ